MGAKHSVQKKLSDSIDAQLRKDFERELACVKLLLLGAADCGKSTVLKQMRILHSSGFHRHELQLHAPIIRSFVLESMTTLCCEMQRLYLEFGETERQWDELLVKQELLLRKVNSDPQPFSEALIYALKRLWQDNGIQACLGRCDEFKFNISAKYFLNDLDRIGDCGYVPTQDDILRVRIPTTSIVEFNFEIENRVFRVFDVGGQRSQRRKWFHVFDKLVSAIIFIAAISEYNQLAYDFIDERRPEDANNNSKQKDRISLAVPEISAVSSVNNDPANTNSTLLAPNRLVESLRLFKSICRNELFESTTMILFLNKIDLFAEKIDKFLLNAVFPNYTGGPDYQEGLTYIRRKFMTCDRRNKRRNMFVHYTCATDTKQIQVVDSAVIQTILCQNMKEMGINTN